MKFSVTETVLDFKTITICSSEVWMKI